MVLKRIFSSIFFKIFFWFWLATILSGITFYVLTTITQSSTISKQMDRLSDNRRRLSGQSMVYFGEAAIRIYENHGPEALKNFAKNLEEKTGIHTFLFPGGFDAIEGQETTFQARVIADRSRRSRKAEFGAFNDIFLVAQPMRNQMGRLYIVVGEIPGTPPESAEPFYSLPQDFGARSLITFIIGGIICSGLAWHLASPIRKLRNATQQFAEGDFTTRVRPDLGNRGDEIGGLAREFDQMAERIEALMTAQKRLIRDVSHELRSPLARLNVALELVRQKTGPEAETSLDRIKQEAERLNEMIGELLSLNALESKDDITKREMIDLDLLVQEIVEDADFEAHSRNCGVRIVAVEAVKVLGISEMLSRAIENVMRNAVRYTAENTEVEVKLNCTHDGNKAIAVVTVRDHGPGVPDNELEKIFQPFYRVADARDRQSGGTGIGLAITERAVRLHGGEVKADNLADGGLQVKIFLPMEPVS